LEGHPEDAFSRHFFWRLTAHGTMLPLFQHGVLQT
jgi:hypothetical protein